MSFIKLTRSILNRQYFPLFISLMAGIITIPFLVSNIATTSLPFVGHARNAAYLEELSDAAADIKDSSNQFNAGQSTNDQNEIKVNNNREDYDNMANNRRLLDINNEGDGNPGAGVNAPLAVSPTPTQTPIAVISQPVTGVKDGAEYFLDGTEAGRDGVVAWSNCIKNRPNQSNLDVASCSAEAENAYNKKAKELMQKDPQDFLERKKVDEATQKLKQYDSTLTNEEIAIGANLYKKGSYRNEPNEKEIFSDISDNAKAIVSDNKKIIDLLPQLSLNYWAILNENIQSRDPFFFRACSYNNLKICINSEIVKIDPAGELTINYSYGPNTNYTSKIKINPKSLPELALNITEYALTDLKAQAERLLNDVIFANKLKQSKKEKINYGESDNYDVNVVETSKNGNAIYPNYSFEYNSQTNKVSVAINGLKLDGDFKLPEPTATSAGPTPTAEPPTNTPPPNQNMPQIAPTSANTPTPGASSTSLPTTTSTPTRTPLPTNTIAAATNIPEAPGTITVVDANGTSVNVDNIAGLSDSDIKIIKDYFKLGAFELDKNSQLGNAVLWTSKSDTYNPENEKAYNAYADNFTSGTNKFMEVSNRIYEKLEAKYKDSLNITSGTATPTRTNTPLPVPTSTPTPAQTPLATIVKTATDLWREGERTLRANLTESMTGNIIIYDANGNYVQITKPKGLSEEDITSLKNLFKIYEYSNNNNTVNFSPNANTPEKVNLYNTFREKIGNDQSLLGDTYDQIFNAFNNKKAAPSTTPTPPPTQSPTPLATLTATITNTISAIATALGLNPSPTPTATPTITPSRTNTPGAVATTNLPTPTARAIPTSEIVNNAPKNDFDASKLPDKNPFGTTVGDNLSNRAIPINSTRLAFSDKDMTGKSIFLIDSNVGDTDAPQLSCLLHAANGSCIKSPEITNLYQMDNWSWDDPAKKTTVKNTGKIQPNTDDDKKPKNWGVQAIGLTAPDADTIRVPGVKDGNLNGNIKVEVLFANDNSITLRYFNKNVKVTDSVAKANGQENIDHAFTVHLTNVAVAKDILDKVNAIGNNVDRKYLVELSIDDIVGKPKTGQEVVVSVRAAGAIMDPRVKNDWWVDAPQPVNNGLTSIDKSSSITPTAETNVLAKYEIGPPVQKGDENKIKEAISLNPSSVQTVSNPPQDVKEKDDPRHPALDTIFPSSTNYNIKNYKGCPQGQTCSAEVTILGLTPSNQTLIKAPVAANGNNYDIGGGFGTMVTYKCPDNKCIALNYSPDALKTPTKGYTIIISGDVEIDPDLIKSYDKGIKSGLFPTLKPGQDFGKSKGEVKISIINDGQFANPYSFFKKTP